MLKYLILTLLVSITLIQEVVAQNEISISRENKIDINLELPAIIVANVKSRCLLEVDAYKDIPDTLAEVIIDGDAVELRFIFGEAHFHHIFTERSKIIVKAAGHETGRGVNPIPLWISILPPLITILLALIFKEVFSALFIGLWIGTITIAYFQGASVLASLATGFFRIIDTYIIQALNNPSHLAIIIFSMMIGGTVNLVSANGGMSGVVNILSRYAKNPKSGQFVTWILGIAIFFDDYANTLVVGNTMRPVTDRLKISREKLAYIVDSTAAPIAAIALITTWIGAELSYIDDGIKVLGLEENAYQIFLSSLKYSYYPVLTIIFIFLLINSGKEFGPMLGAEHRARKSKPGQGISKEAISGETFNNISGNIKPRWYNAAVPVLVIIFGTVAAMFYTGLQSYDWDKAYGFARNISNIVGFSDSYKALLWASLSGMFVAIVMTLFQKILSLRKSLESVIDGFKTLFSAVLILVLAWSMAMLTEHLHTANYIAQILDKTQVTPLLLPAITFILSSLIAFSTGSSWGTMAILYPLILPTAWILSIDGGLDYQHSMQIFQNVVAVVLAGSVLGDHCSPISDTTILSSLASSCNHISHVRTQLPYALTVGLVAVLFGTIPAAYNVPAYILFPVSILMLYLVIQIAGRKVEANTNNTNNTNIDS